ncbi:MAG TPA: clostripain-related cysteine peptidase, partial [Chthonomonadales bacterium]|nr:clostripain-related cysteine peptidase [Chthonomonadales bacterium]
NMCKSAWLRRTPGISLLGVLLVMWMMGCGSGGGSGQRGQFVGTYRFTSGAQTFVMSVDTMGRFTLFARDASTLQAGIGAQGSVATNGQFFAQSGDGLIQFQGTVARNGSSATGSVERSGQPLFSFNAAAASSGASTPIAFRGTFFGSSSAASALLTIDATSHATLWATAGATTGGGFLDVAPDGTLTSPDGLTVGQLVVTQQATSLRLTKLGGTGVNLDLPLTTSSRAKWTFLVFLNAANNLQEFGPLNVNQMEKIGSTADVNIVVQWKQANCSSCGRPDWVGTRRYFITKDNDPSRVNSQLVQDLGPNIDMGDWRELRNFIVWTQQRYPADRYALVIWNHGAGWRPTRLERDRRLTPFPRSVSIDDSTGSEIQTWQLPQALSVTPRMDMVIFDASLMQMAEVAYEIRESAQVVVGSEESPPGEGYVYDTFLADLIANPNMTPAQLGTQIVNRTLEAYGTNSNNTQSAIDLSKMQNVADKVSAFASSLQAHISDSRQAMIDARNNARNYAFPENKDLVDYADRIKGGTAATDLKAAADAVRQAVIAAVIAERHGDLSSGSHGLAIYVPAPFNYLSSYANLAFARATAWDEWLQNQPQ